MKNMLNGFSRGFGYTIGKLIVYFLLVFFLANSLKGCETNEIEKVFDTFFVN